jgi:dipeptidyl aminopeptidase/acylaminoacyl peptidase
MAVLGSGKASMVVAWLVRRPASFTPIEIERYEGPLFISHGTNDRMWSVEMSRRIVNRLSQHGKKPAIHFYEGQSHMPDGEGENEHHERLIAFLRDHLLT